MTDFSEGLAAAIRRLPDYARAIEEQARQSQSFRDLCEDLAVAERSLALAESAPAEVRNERRVEWSFWTGTLTREIEETLRSAKIVSIDQRHQHSLRRSR
jgi:hypothetical protein